MFTKAGMHVVLPGILGMALMIAPLAQADNQADEKPAAKKTSPSAHPSKPAQTTTSGMVVVKDPVTGLLRAPTAEEAAALAAAAPAAQRASTAGAAVTFDVPGGGTGYVLDDSTVIYAVATKGGNGNIVVGEVVGADAARNAAAAKVKATKSGAAKK